MSVISTNIGEPSYPKEPKREKTPNYLHIDPTSTTIDFDSLLDVINNTAKNPVDVYNYDASSKEYVDLTITKDDLLPTRENMNYSTFVTQQQKDFVKKN